MLPLILGFPAATLIACAALLLSVLLLWTRPTVWIAAVTATVGLGYLAQVLYGPAALWLLVMAATALQIRSARGPARALWVVVTGTVSLLLGLHLLPGFSNPVVIADAVLAQGALPYTQYVNFDKGLGGVLLLGCSGWVAMRAVAEWRAAIRRAAPWTALTVGVAMATAFALGVVRFEPRWPASFYVWAPVNLLLTCVAEEAFFRGLLQRELTRALDGVRHRAAIAVITSGVLFGLAHLAGGPRYVLLATLAGLGYAAVYQQTSRLEMSILTHFAVNSAHFLLFTYPMLA